MIANADSSFVDDPELSGAALQPREAKTRENEFQYGDKPLIGWPKHPNASVTCRRVSPDVGEIQIECDQDPILGNACGEQGRIFGARQALGQGSLDIMSK